ncbi:hypothetical protein [Corynebacterium glutamicum]|uniref:hypothetical protein n=1 Tax=Corynebacterium glutamicum TaxID=1718 RepID=UPI001E39006E|nr:hypothetical protein [Corynebacterium glutamicum]
MTVNIPTVDTAELTPEQKRDHVIAYLSRPTARKVDTSPSTTCQHQRLRHGAGAWPMVILNVG